MSNSSSMFKSSLGKKLVMGITGLFLISFLMVHCFLNSLIFLNDGGETFNLGAEFMAKNWLIRAMEIVLFGGLLWHIIQAAILTRENKKARPVAYAASNPSANSKWYSRSMGLLGTILLIFLIIHLRHFWVVSRFTDEITSGRETLFNEMKEVFTPLQVKTKAKTTQLEALNKEGQMKPEMRETIEKQMRVLKRELEDLSNEAQALIGKKQDEQVVLIYREVQEAAQRVAVAHGYDMVLHYNDPTTSAEYWSAGNIVRKMQAGACMPIYFAPGIDISADVVNALNQAYSRVAPPAAPAGSAITPTSATTPK